MGIIVMETVGQLFGTQYYQRFYSRAAPAGMKAIQFKVDMSLQSATQIQFILLVAFKVGTHRKS